MQKIINNKRKIILQIHKYLGLVTGLVVFIVSITGCLWVFKEEISSFSEDYKTVVPKEKAFLKASEIKQFAEAIVPGKSIHGTVFGQPNEAIEVVFYEAKPERFYQSVFLNPYTGDFIKKVDHTTGFFAFVLNGHMTLWLPGFVGSRIVSYSILLFFIIIISGIVLWLPKKAKNWRQRLKFDWNQNTRWKRKNFDLHTVIGFYSATFGLVLAFTGCVMAFGWFYFIAYKGLGGTKNFRFSIPDNVTTLAIAEEMPKYDLLIPQLSKQYPDAKSLELHYPENDTTAILVEVNNANGAYYNMDYLFFDQYTLQEVEVNSIYGKYKNTDFADKVIRMNYDIHVGAIGGLVGKFIAFFASLICATLPVTGILLWFGKKYKVKEKNKVIAVELL